ncbi:MAG: hypothetical protein ABIK73_06060 [candidate division WOR-3 bacterium]
MKYDNEENYFYETSSITRERCVIYAEDNIMHIYLDKDNVIKISDYYIIHESPECKMTCQIYNAELEIQLENLDFGDIYIYLTYTFSSDKNVENAIDAVNYVASKI